MSAPVWRIVAMTRSRETRWSPSSRAYVDGGVLVPAEHHIGGFHDWLLARLEA